MALVKLGDFYPDYREEHSDIDDIKNFDVYAQGDNKVGSVYDILVDEQTGKFRYFIVDTGFWVFGK
jgi:sporulation protein YlmC with PRC-barrel domain